VVPLVAQRRGPKPRMPDADLLNAIRADLAASPFIGNVF
jgi:putative transposase